MVQNLDRRPLEGGREIPPMTKEILEARTRKSIEELRQLYNTDERLADLAQEVARPGEVEAYAESGRSLQNEIREIMRTHESKEGFFSKAGKVLKGVGKWALRNWLPLTLAGVGLYGYVNRGPIMQWGSGKVTQGVEWLKGRITGPLKAQLDALMAQNAALQQRFDALRGRVEAPPNTGGAVPLPPPPVANPADALPPPSGIGPGPTVIPPPRPVAPPPAPGAGGSRL